jgi:putative lysine transport system substrate-binding protein
MRKIIEGLILGAALFGLASCGVGSADDSESVRVGMECAYVPYNWEEGSPSADNVALENHSGFYADGYDVQIAKKLAEGMGKEAVFVKIGWDGLMTALNQGQIDLIVSGMLDSPEHKQAADFSDTYAVNKTEYTILVKADGKYASANKLSDFSGASILGQKGTRLDTVIDQIPDVDHVSPVDTIPAMLDRLLKDTVDGIVINADTVAIYESQYPQLTGVHFAEGAGFVLDFSGICVGIRKGETALKENVNSALMGISGAERKALFDGAKKRAEAFQ